MATVTHPSVTPPVVMARASTWDPDNPAVVVDKVRDGTRVFQVRHDSYPYTAQWNERANGDGLFTIAEAYLASVNSRLLLPPELVTSLTDSAVGFAGFCLRWLPFTDDPRNSDPRSSHWVERQGALNTPQRPVKGQALDRTGVLLVTLAVKSFIGDLLRFGGQGLRILVLAGQPNRGGSVNDDFKCRRRVFLPVKGRGERVNNQ